MFTVEADPLVGDAEAPDERVADFRSLIGNFATGVTVITSEYRGRRFATTANSLTSVSLQPLIVLVCFAKDSETRRAVMASSRFGVSILDAERGEALSRRFASKAVDGRDQLEDVETVDGGAGIPVLAHHCAYLTCSLHRSLPVGDHDVCFGRVLEFGGPGPDAPPPLLFHGGKYRTLGPGPADLADTTSTSMHHRERSTPS